MFDNFCVICKDASLEVAFVVRLHTDAGTSKVCATDVYFFSV